MEVDENFVNNGNAHTAGSSSSNGINARRVQRSLSQRIRSMNNGFATVTENGITLNRPLLTSMDNAGGNCVDGGNSRASARLLLNRRSSSGIFISSMFGSRFRHLQKLHTDAFGLGLNNVCMSGLPFGTMFRSSLPATPVSTPIHREFTHFTEQAIRERLCRTPSPRKGRLSALHLDLCSRGSGLNSLTETRPCDEYDEASLPMEISSPATPIEEISPEDPRSDEEQQSIIEVHTRPPLPPSVTHLIASPPLTPISPPSEQEQQPQQQQQQQSSLTDADATSMDEYFSPQSSPSSAPKTLKNKKIFVGHLSHSVGEEET